MYQEIWRHSIIAGFDIVICEILHGELTSYMQLFGMEEEVLSLSYFQCWIKLELLGKVLNAGDNLIGVEHLG